MSSALAPVASGLAQTSNAAVCSWLEVLSHENLQLPAMLSDPNTTPLLWREIPELTSANCAS